MEYLLVHFVPTQRRTVVVNGALRGETEDLIPLPAGTHIVTLMPPPDFRPAELKVILNGTTSIQPAEVTFTQVGRAASST